MKIAVIGGGAIGSIVAGYLANAGEDVVLVARGEHAAVVNREGLAVSGLRTDSIRVKALTKLDQPYDLVIFATKTQDLEAAYQENNEFLETGLIMTSQNGVQADNILSVHFERERMISSIVMFGATFIKPGHVTYNFEGDWIIGRPFTPNDPKVHEVAAMLMKAFKVVVADNIIGMKYLKLFVNFNNCIPALIGKSMQETFADLDFCRLSVSLLKEGVSIVDQAKIELVSLPSFPKERIHGLAHMPAEQGAVIVNQTLTGLSKAPLYGSILQSIMRGKTSEIDFINGEVVHLASNIRMDAPLNRKMVDMVHQVEETGKYFTPEEVKKAFGLEFVNK